MGRKSNYYSEPKPEGTNRRVLENALAPWTKERVDVKDPAAIEKRISDYLQYCMDKDIAPSAVGCANWLGITEQTLKAWYTGYSGTVEHQRVASQLYMVLQDVWSQNMTEGNINPVSGIFMGKAFYGYKDTTEIVVNNRSQNMIASDDLIAQAKMLPGAEPLMLPSEIDKDEGEGNSIEDAYRQRAIDRNAEKEQKEAERKATQELLAPYREQKKKEYLKEYYQENAENYNPSRKTPEGRAKYNEYMREFKRKRKAQKEAQKGIEDALFEE